MASMQVSQNPLTMSLLFRGWLFFFLCHESASAASTATTLCQLELHMDDHPEQVAYEIRGPVPSMAVTAETNFGYFNTVQHSNRVVRETFHLQPEESYNLILLDQAEDGIQQGGKFVLSCKFGAYDKVFLEREANYGAGGIYLFEVQPPPSQRTRQQNSAGNELETSRLRRGAANSESKC